jgi:hypothetical protein
VETLDMARRNTMLEKIRGSDDLRIANDFFRVPENQEKIIRDLKSASELSKVLSDVRRINSDMLVKQISI